MTTPRLHDMERRVLILAPFGRDAELTHAILAKVDIEAVICEDVAELCCKANEGAACLIVAEEALTHQALPALADFLARQPPWSDLGLMLMMHRGTASTTATTALERLGSATLLERPVRVSTLVSAVRAAMRARNRQYELRARFEVQALLAEIVASSDDAIISKTLDGIILSWNAGAERIFGYSADEAIGRPITIIVPPDRLDEERNILERLRRGESIEHFSTTRVSKDGRLLDISVTISPLRDSEDRIVGASKVARDISAEKRAELALVEADRRKDEFLATLAHELRNPLAPIRNSLQILRLAAITDPAVKQIQDVMERQVNHMVRLVDDLMEVSRITRGKIELRRERVELATIIRNAVETSQPLIDSAGHQLALAIPPDPLFVDADPVRLSQVFANLLNNAAKYTPDQGQIWLTVRRERRDVVVRVRDTGVGISQEMLPRVFEMFTQIDGSHRRSQGGLGIGLTLARTLIEMHGGRVTAASEGAGKGSEFIVRLPLAETAQVAGPVPTAKAPQLPSLRVLVVDDNQDAARCLGMLLKFQGAQVQVVHDGPSALQMLDLFDPDVVFLDIGMPGMDGYEVARAIREQPAFRQLKLVALTGWGQEEDRRRARAAGFDEHLMKPADVAALRAVLVSVATSRESHAIDHP